MIEISDLSHVTLIVSDVEASKRFYGGVLGMEQAPTPPGFPPEITWFRRGSAELHLIHRSIAAQDPGDSEADEGKPVTRARHLGLAVADIEGAIGALREHGIRIEAGPKDRGDGAIQIYCYDPDGHLVELHTPPRA